MQEKPETETKIAELLAMLDMTETEQLCWCKDNINMEWYSPECSFDLEIMESLPDLSYRLRGEAEKESLVTGMMIVFRHATGTGGGYDGVFPKMCEWFAIKANAIHVIIVVLIAKLLEKEEKNA